MQRQTSQSLPLEYHAIEAYGIFLEPEPPPPTGHRAGTNRYLFQNQAISLILIGTLFHKRAG
jgi:hypothetical protein